MRTSNLFLILFLLFVPRACLGMTVTYSFRGTVSGLNFGGSPYGLSIPIGTAVSGQFTYDTNSTGTPASAIATKYLQHQTDGFVVQFGSHEFSASHYLVTVTNNAPTPSPHDQFAISFRSDSLLSDYPLNVNSVAQPAGVGLLVVTLPFATSEWAGSSLPTSLDPTHLTLLNVNSLLGAPSPTVVLPKVTFTIQSITLVQEAVPEPGASSLGLTALAVSWGWLRLRNRRRAQ